MTSKLLRVLTFLCVTTFVFAQPGTMRLDYFHTGNSTQEIFSVDRVVLEPLPWPGNLNNSLDATNLGAYFFEVRNQADGKLLYSRGFSSIFGEWVTTDEAKSINRTFSESLRFPAPLVPVKIVVKKRDDGKFREVWSTSINPKDKFVDTSRPPSPGPLLTIQKAGDPATQVDLLILGDGYSAAERPKFEQDARRFSEILFGTSPFREHRQDFNVWGLCPAGEESGVSRPSGGVHHRSPLGATYDTFDTERYILTTDNRSLRDVASFAPYEFIEILVNGKTYGGGGIFNLYATVAADSEWSSYVFVHEFGHHFAGLADEYYTSQVAYVPATHRVEPWEPNVTALLDPTNLKWKDLITPGTPIPTLWHKQDFESYERGIQNQRRKIREQHRPEAEMDALFREERKKEDELLAADKYATNVGAFEGANYEAHGYYRPQENCIMFTRHDSFCAVCRRAIERIIAMYAVQ
jgi:hypothetical protein